MKKLSLIALFLFAVLDGYCVHQLIKADTGKRLTASIFNYNLGATKIKNTGNAQAGAALLLGQPGVYSAINKGDSSKPGRLIGTTWADDIFELTVPDNGQLVNRMIPVKHAEFTDNDRQNFTLKPKFDTVREWKDTICYYNKAMRSCLTTVVELAFENRSADTLKYYNWSCSKLDIFMVDGEGLRIINQSFCFKNNVDVYTVPPHQSVLFHVPVFLPSEGRDKLFVSKSFKIGIGLYKYIPHLKAHLFLPGPLSGDMIWSDDIAIR